VLMAQMQLRHLGSIDSWVKDSRTGYTKQKVCLLGLATDRQASKQESAQACKQTRRTKPAWLTRE